MKKISTFLALFVMAMTGAMAQEVSTVEMATGLRSSGKIYVVVLVIAVLFIGLVSYLFRIDRRVSKLEKSRK